MTIDDEDALREVETAFRSYEDALVRNDLDRLDRLFWPDARAIRYGAAEASYGIDAIRAFRRARSPAGVDRTLERTVITTFGRDFATVSTLFTRPGLPERIGRQQQSWVRFADGWRIVAAHVSIVAAEADPPR